eukprot:gnl/MRDRNA2_/MRDRNA2_90060_c0_seq1.p1 gnl/MRDRNA2_/MRDRNA2_90060_c0~~gnl/MRDRNA2_/MRDRNA2_90060_c0_seq1.p1  ORF type:complete len:344 (-),score=78.92 gnl/MRDRNA2_/MRDRNA2_90060_c0_seq1:146-1177(-)
MGRSPRRSRSRSGRRRRTEETKRRSRDDSPEDSEEASKSKKVDPKNDPAELRKALQMSADLIEKLKTDLEVMEMEKQEVEEKNRDLRRQIVLLRRGQAGSDDAPPARAPPRREVSEEPDDGKKLPWESDNDEEGPGDLPMGGASAAIVCNNLAEVYNQSIPNNIQKENQGKMVLKKMEEFMKLISSDCKVLDANSGKEILRDTADISARYGCVFRESGASLKVTTFKRFYYEVPHKPDPSWCLDLEKHEQLVTPRPGMRLDGSLGTMPARTQHLVVLYRVKDSKVERMWIGPDKTKLGEDAYANEDVLDRAPFMPMFKKILDAECGPKVNRMYNNYHNIATIG